MSAWSRLISTNDMDLDLYMVCRNAISNDADRLYLNNGFGVFTRQAGAGGAEGPIGLDVGLSESVTVADYDVDGRPDLFGTNGLKLVPEFPYTDDGPDLLFHNTTTNDNNWVEFDLRGVQSNRDAIGATVTATAGGVTQTRARDGQYHRWSQNDPRLHFGLGDERFGGYYSALAERQHFELQRTAGERAVRTRRE